MNSEPLMFAEAIFPLMAAYVRLGSHLQGCARARACVPCAAGGSACGGTRCSLSAPTKRSVSPQRRGAALAAPPRLQPRAPSILPLIRISILLRRLLSSPPLLLSPKSRPDSRLSAVTCSLEAQMVPVDGWSEGRRLCNLLVLEHPLEAALTSCQSPCKVVPYPKPAAC